MDSSELNFADRVESGQVGDGWKVPEGYLIDIFYLREICSFCVLVANSPKFSQAII